MANVHALVKAAVRDGLLPPPPACEVCGALPLPIVVRPGHLHARPNLSYHHWDVDNSLRRWLIASLAAFRLAAQDETPNREETP